MRKLMLGLAAGYLALCLPAQAANDAAAKFQQDFLAGKLDWAAVQQAAKQEGAVNLYYWGGSDRLNVWMDQVVAPAMAEFGVKLKLVQVTDTKDAIDLTLAEKGAGKGIGEGSVDAVWVNGENFATLKGQKALFGSFAQKVPNAKNIDWDPKDSRSLLNLRDFGVVNDSAEMPWSGEQYVCAVNGGRVADKDVPHTFDQLKTYLQAHPGKFAYVKPPNYLGNTFVQEAVYAHNPDGNGAIPFQKSRDELGAAEIARLIKPGLEYLKSIQPLLLNASGGKPRYPENVAELDGLFLNGQIDFDCKFGLYAVANDLATGTYPEKAREFIFPEGTMIKNKNYLAIPSTAPHPAAALLLTNYMASVESQVSKLKQTGMPAGINSWLLSAADAKAITDASPGHVGVTQEDLDKNTAPDTNATLVNVIEATWLDYIERGSNNSIETIVQRAVKNLASK